MWERDETKLTKDTNKLIICSHSSAKVIWNIKYITIIAISLLAPVSRLNYLGRSSFHLRIQPHAILQFNFMRGCTHIRIFWKTSCTIANIDNTISCMVPSQFNGRLGKYIKQQTAYMRIHWRKQSSKMRVGWTMIRKILPCEVYMRIYHQNHI